LTDPRSEDKEKVQEYAGEVLKALSQKIRTKDRDEWLGLFEEAGVIAAPIHDIDEAAAHPQVLANEYIVEVDHPIDGRLRILGLPVKLHKTPGKVGLAPELGRHTEEILTGVAGYSLEEIARMRTEEII
jgi:crotonobetainyl-CoA:carnitine CoA-transferase CaiB-like acyl-CoA transferase